jgi:hypothetical protein
MKRRIKVDFERNIIFHAVTMFIIACLSINAYFYVGYGNLNAYDNTSQPAVKTGNEHLMKMGDADYYFLEHLFRQTSLISKLLEIKSKAAAPFADIAELGVFCFQIILIVIFFYFSLSLFITLPDDFTPVNQKVRLDD